ncbi:MAG: hypothetical protein N3F07_00590 [Candidatus Micrarchaeota archaeon]|nr:hypothetical protein [Candidatus Micrarchaeota archaeon]
MEDLLRLLAKKPKSPPSSPPASSPPSDDELKLRLCRLIIERYREKIEESETKSVSDLKSMVNPKDACVVELKEAITESFHPYVYSEHFLDCAKMAFKHVSAFKTVSAPVSFWLSFSEIKELMAGDEIDKSIFLCSILRALGSENAKVFVTDTRNSYVLFQFRGKSFVADHSKEAIQEFASGQQAMDSLKGKIIYAFNDLAYEDFQESGQVF